jgi:uncharacterized membrane protein (DUF485 family)
MIAQAPGTKTSRGDKTPQQVLDSPEFQHLVSRQWTVSILLTVVLFVLYYGFILLIALDKPFLARRIGEATTLGIPVGVGVILVAWVLTASYVRWANKSHDPEVTRLRGEMGR